MPEQQPRSSFCSRCGRPVVVADAAYCKNCGSALFAGVRLRRGLTWNPALAAGLSLVPGAGHAYKGRYVAAALWFIGVLVAYGAPPFGLLLHLVCAANAALAGALEWPGRQPAGSAGQRPSQASEGFNTRT